MARGATAAISVVDLACCIPEEAITGCGSGGASIVCTRRGAQTGKLLPGLELCEHHFTRPFRFELVDPGLVYVSQWRPDSPADVPSDPGQLWGLVGVGRKR